METERIYGRLNWWGVFMFGGVPLMLLYMLFAMNVYEPIRPFLQAIFVVGITVSLLQLFLVWSNIYYLHLTPTGWREHGAPYARFYRWDECSNFYPAGIGQVGFKRADGKRRTLNLMLGHDPEKTAARLNAYRDQALARIERNGAMNAELAESR